MAPNATVTLIVEWYNRDDSYLQKLKELPSPIEQVIVLTGDDSSALPQDSDSSKTFTILSYPGNFSKISNLNDAITKAEHDWILLLEESELIFFPGLLELPLDNKDAVFAARIQKQDDPTKRIFYEIRLFPKLSDFEIKGIQLRDFHPAVSKNELSIHTDKVDILRENEYIGDFDLDRELERDTEHGPALLMKAVTEAADRKYKEASDSFIRAIQSGRLFKFDHAAALNGLADASFELNRWHDSKERAEKSLTLTHQQRMPHLILFRTSFASNRWGEAYDHLYRYLEVLASGTEVNQDVIFPLSDTQYLLGEAAYRNGWHERALAHYEQYYDLKKGNIQPEVIERLLLYAIELSEYDKSLVYFNHLFGDVIKEPLSASDETRILEVLSLFMEQGWHEFSLEVYEVICRNNPEKPELIRRWVAALIRAQKVEKAQEIIANNQTKFA